MVWSWVRRGLSLFSSDVACPYQRWSVPVFTYEFAYDYLFRSGKPYFYYSRDAQHANEYNRVLSAKQLFEVFKLVAAKDFTTP